MFNKPTLANNRYELINTLGQGGMACVFKALDTRLKVEKAIKIPNHHATAESILLTFAMPRPNRFYENIAMLRS